jgi:hypothetical protein
VLYENKSTPYAKDVMAERLRRWTANPLGSARAGSNPADIALNFTRCSSVGRAPDCSGNNIRAVPGSNPGGETLGVILIVLYLTRVVGLMVRIDAFQALGSGSIPGRL